MRSILLVAVAIGALLSAAEQTQSSGAREYRAAVEAYRSGAPAADVLPADADGASDPEGTWSAIDLEAAAMLHTDVSLRLVKAGRSADARAYLDAASRLLRAAVARDAAAADYARRWRDTISGLLDAFNARALAKEIDRDGRDWWPESKETEAARKAYADGLTHEIQAAVAGPLSGPPPAQSVGMAREAVVPLHQAQLDYARALGLDPRRTDAALHLGRVELLLWHDAEAAAQLRAAASATNPSVRYLALMYLAAIDEHAGRLDAAIEQYRRARATFRWAQSAPLALSHALMRAGRDAEARDVLADHFNSTSQRSWDPLWTYLADPATDLGPTLDELRAEIWR